MDKRKKGATNGDREQQEKSNQWSRQGEEGWLNAWIRRVMRRKEQGGRGAKSIRGRCEVEEVGGIRRRRGHKTVAGQ